MHPTFNKITLHNYQLNQPSQNADIIDAMFLHKVIFN